MAVINNFEQLSSFEEFELGSGNAVQVKEFLELVYDQVKQKQVVTTTLNFGAVDYRTNENMCMQADISKLRSLGWEPTANLEDGIKNIIDGALND